MLSLAGQMFIVTKIVPLRRCTISPKIFCLNFHERLQFSFTFACLASGRQAFMLLHQ
ncbi:MAG: hypothetical protein LBP59_00810 [Planctomycetaceae bacterium]|nr:hypothetical protein [Planctomycetaceae bacterium]